MSRPLAPVLSPALWALALVSACEDEPVCEEDVKAQVLDERVEISVGGVLLEAELADEDVERDRGWRHRVCDREALLLVPDEPASSLGIWGCGLVEPVDAWFIADGAVVELARIAPCPEPCSSCPVSGEALLVDAVLETPADSLDAALGDPVSW